MLPPRSSPVYCSQREVVPSDPLIVRNEVCLQSESFADEQPSEPAPGYPGALRTRNSAIGIGRIGLARGGSRSEVPGSAPSTASPPFFSPPTAASAAFHLLVSPSFLFAAPAGTIFPPKPGRSAPAAGKPSILYLILKLASPVTLCAAPVASRLRTSPGPSPTGSTRASCGLCCTC